MSKLRLFLVPAFGLSVSVACGAQVVVVDDDGGAGGGGAGSSHASSSTGPTSVVSSAAGPTTASGSAALCDFSAFSGECTECIDNAINTAACEAPLDACYADPQCLAYDGCIFGCNGDAGCCGSCASTVPASAVDVWEALVDCFYCQNCPAACVALAGDFCSG